MNITHPYTDIAGRKALRGNLHTHTTRSDGTNPPQMVIDGYAKRGYDFLMLSDHDVYTTPAELAAWNNRGMVLIPGNEVSANGPHIQHIGAGGKVEPAAQRQTVISQIVERGGVAVVNHPNWQPEFDHCTLHQLKEWVGYSGIEIYNGVINRLDGSPYALMKWDKLLSLGRRVWGFATDDMHHPASDLALGWVMVYAKDRTPTAIVEALRDGKFYSSTGVEITKIAVEGDKIRIVTKNAQRISALMQTGRRFAFADGKELEVTVPANAAYVRFECWGAGESFAWTQPFFMERAKTTAAQRGFFMNWQVSELVPNLDSTSATPQNPLATTGGGGKKGAAKGAKGKPALQWTEAQASGPPDGFLDARFQIGGRAGVVYCWTQFESPTAGQAQLFLGYDGPVRAWINAEQVFDGPGTNPATPDKAAVHVAVQRGENTLLVALGTNEGKAWGILARCVLPKK